MKEKIVVLLTGILAEMGVGDVVVDVAPSEDPKHGDYATNVAMRLAKVLKRSPITIATEIKDKIIRDQKASKLEWLQDVQVAPPGFVNLFVSEASLITELTEVLEKTEAYGRGQTAQKKEGEAHKVMVEFADPNPFKEFHIGHMRNITLGESYCRLLEAIGHEVRRVNYQGDVGMHVAKSLWGLEQMIEEGFDINASGINPREKAAMLGKAYARGAKAYEEQETAKQEIITLNKKVYAQDPSIMELWKKGRQISLDYFDTIYERVGTTFTRFYFESEVAPLGMKLVGEHIKDGVFEESDGAIVFRGEKVGLHTRVFVTKEKYATYEGKDLALAVLKHQEWPCDLSIIMTGNEQSPYFEVMLAALRQIRSEVARKTRHVSFGMVNLKDGKMSSRTGNVITAEWLIDQAKEKIIAILSQSTSKYDKKHPSFVPMQNRDYGRAQQNDIAEKAAIAAVKYSMLKVTAPSDIAFDLDRSVTFDGDSGPYLQYTYARCRSVLRKAGSDTSLSSSRMRGSAFGKAGPPVKPEDDSVLNSEERAVVRLISQFPDVVADAAQNFSPNTLCTYLFGLAQSFNLFYAKHSILGTSSSFLVHRSSQKEGATRSSVNDLPSTIYEFRLALTAATAQVLKNGLYLLGIDVLEQM